MKNQCVQYLCAISDMSEMEALFVGGRRPAPQASLRMPLRRARITLPAVIAVGALGLFVEESMRAAYLKQAYRPN